MASPKVISLPPSSVGEVRARTLSGASHARTDGDRAPPGQWPTKSGDSVRVSPRSNWHLLPVLGLERNRCGSEARVSVGHEGGGVLERALNQVARGKALAHGHAGGGVEDLGLRQRG